jgi:hypothetical protein
VHCGAISVRPGMTVKAVAYKSGGAQGATFRTRELARFAPADSVVAEATWPARK